LQPYYMRWRVKKQVVFSKRVKKCAVVTEHAYKFNICLI
jgi:hypothetical protein